MIRVLGPFPPPYGGVALHCVRLVEALRNKGLIVCATSLGGVPSGIVGVSKWKPWMMLSRTPVHYHTDEGNHRWMRLFAWLWRLRNTPYIVTVHSFRDRSEFQDRKVLRQLSLAYARARAIIAISDEVADQLTLKLGIDRSAITVIASNLPVSRWEHSSTMPDTIATEWRSANVRIIANAGRIVSYKGEDLYGLDVLVKAFNAITDSDVGLCLVVGEVVDESIFSSLVSLIGDDKRITLVQEFPAPLTALVKHSHIVVRPTRTEGGPSLTLGEAIELGKWAIGSDAVPRPVGTVLFTNSVHKDLSRALLDSIANVRANRFPMPFLQSSDVLDQIINVYHRSGFVNTTHTPAEV